jgi:hypothetical protein
MTAPTMMQRFDALDRLLVAKGFPATSPWWRQTLADFYAQHVRQLVLRVGRRGGKSSTLSRVAVLEALYGEHRIPPGDVGVVAFISVTRDEANQRLRLIKAILDAVGVEWRPADGGVELERRPILFKVFAATMAGVVGFTGVACFCDEVARWRRTCSPCSRSYATGRRTRPGREPAERAGDGAEPSPLALEGQCPAARAAPGDRDEHAPHVARPPGDRDHVVRRPPRRRDEGPLPCRSLDRHNDGGLHPGGGSHPRRLRPAVPPAARVSAW